MFDICWCMCELYNGILKIIKLMFSIIIYDMNFYKYKQLFCNRFFYLHNLKNKSSKTKVKSANSIKYRMLMYRFHWVFARTNLLESRFKYSINKCLFDFELKTLIKINDFLIKRFNKTYIIFLQNILSYYCFDYYSVNEASNKFHWQWNEKILNTENKKILLRYKTLIYGVRWNK